MTSEAPPEIKALIDTLLGAFNRRDSMLYNSIFSDNVVVIDGMAPYRWTGPNAQGRWFADAEKWAQEVGVTSGKVDYDRIVHAEITGTNAYAVVSATFSFRRKGVPQSRRGILTFTCANQGGRWRVESQAWGRSS